MLIQYYVCMYVCTVTEVAHFVKVPKPLDL